MTAIVVSQGVVDGLVPLQSFAVPFPVQARSSGRLQIEHDLQLSQQRPHQIDRQHAAIKLYLAKVTQRSLSEADALRTQELLGACVKLEHVGDIVVRNMLAHVRKKAERGLEFTPEGWSELLAFHNSVMANARLAFNVLVSRDAETARTIVHEKDRLRDLEKRSSQSHFLRLRDGTAKSVETSSIHLDTIRDLKQINSLLASIAYPVLEEHGLLSGTRLKAV